MNRTVQSIFGLLLALTAMAQPSQLESLTIEDGLSQGMIFDMLQTKDGFLWIATKDGLNRYDGYNFKIFSNNPFNPFSLAENTVTALFEDSRGWLWVGTRSKGLELYNPRTERYHHFQLDFKEKIASSGVTVNKILEAADGSIWVLKDDVGLVQVQIPEAWNKSIPDEPDLEKLTKVAPMQLPKSQGCELDWLFDFFILKNGELLVTSPKGQIVIDLQNSTCRPINTDILPPLANTIFLPDMADMSKMWIGNLNELCWIENGKVTRHSLPRLSNPNWTGLHHGRNGHAWFVLNRSLWDLGPGEKFDASKPDLTLDENANSLTVDRNGNVWIGTIGYGLRKYNPAKKLFHTGAKGRSITGVWRSPIGKYFAKSRTTSTFVFAYDPKTGQLTDQTAFPDAPTQHISIAFEPDGAVWLLCTSPLLQSKGMLCRYDANGSATSKYAFEAEVTLYDQLLRNKKGQLWISARDCQLLRFDPKTAQFKQMDFSHVFGKKASSVNITALAEDESGTLWVGTQFGLVKCVPKGNSFEFELIQADRDNPLGLNNNTISSLLPGPNSVLWVGTKGGGINYFDIKSHQFLQITSHEGLPNDVVYGILPNGEDELWCSTNRGLAKIMLHDVAGQPLQYDITAFTANMGLQDNEFNTSAFFKAENGELLFGGVNGLNHFFPAELSLDTISPPIYITGLEINHTPVGFGSPGSPLEQPLAFLRELRLNYEQNNLSFEFAALDFTDPDKNRYRYRLVGLDDDWVETGTLRFAHFTHLSPGTYRLEVQGSNGESAWNDAANPISITINPPWWRSKLAYFCYLALVVWVGVRAYKLQLQRVKEREQLAFEHRETLRIKALEQVKTNFFNNITHEFRTPLTLIIEPLRQILKNPDAPGLTENIRLAEKNSQRLMNLVNQLLDMAKLESGTMTLDLRSGNFAQVVSGIFEAFQPLAAQRNIQCIMLVEDKIPPLTFDKDKTELVLNNLLSNALKFTPPGGNVKLSLGLRTYHDGLYSEVFVAIKDTGIGIPEEALDRVFERFYQVDNPHTQAGEGTGIGLALSKELAKLMGGGITVESKVGEGAVFTFWFPMKLAAEEATVLPTEQEASVVFEKSAPVDLANGEKPVVLVVEDNVELRQFLRQSVSSTWQVLEATNGEEGLSMAIELLPDLVVSDLMMPLKDGYALCDELKANELTAHIPVILLTARAGIEAKLKGLRTGADDYLTKPFNTEELLVRMENLVKSRQKLREHYSKLPVSQSVLEEDGLSRQDREFLQKLNSLLEQYLTDESLGVEDFAKKMFISRVQLHRKLKAITDRSATDFIRDFRLERAHAMLKNREGLVGEIAMRVGFGNEKYFSTVFKEKFGVSPSQVA